MNLGQSVFCKDTLTGKVAPRCFSFLFGMDPNADPIYLDWLISVWDWTLAVAGLSLALAMVMGIVIGMMSTLPPKHLVNRLCSAGATAWVELFRNILLLVQVFLWYHVVPAFSPIMKDFPILFISEHRPRIVRFGTHCRTGPRGIQSLPIGRWNAAIALGMTTAQSYRYVLFPMGICIIIPPLTSECINVVKNLSVAFAVSVPELTLFVLQAQEEISCGIEIYLAVTGLYMVSALSVNRIMTWVEKKRAFLVLLRLIHPQRIKVSDRPWT